MAATALLPHLHPTLSSSAYSRRFPLFHLSTVPIPIPTTATPSLHRLLLRCKPPPLHAVSPPFSLLEESSDLESDGGEESVDGFESDGGEDGVDGFESDGGERSVDGFQSGSESDEGEPKGRATPLVASRVQLPKLTTKEKKELVSYARGLGKKLDVQQVGKSGVTPSLAAAFRDNLEANELLKVKVHGTCPMEFVNVVKQLEQATGSIALGQVGRTVILYRPSLSKMKRKEEQAARARKVWKPRSRSPPNSSRTSKNGQTRSFSRSSTRSTRSPTNPRRRSS